MDRGDDGFLSVADVLAADAAREVEVFAAVDVPDAGAFGALDDDRGGADSPRDVPVAGFVDALGGAAFSEAHGARAYTDCGAHGTSCRARRTCCSSEASLSAVGRGWIRALLQRRAILPAR